MEPNITERTGGVFADLGFYDAAHRGTKTHLAMAVNAILKERRHKQAETAKLRAIGELVIRVFGAIAHFDRPLISERAKDGIAAARAKGKKLGRQTLVMKAVEAAIRLIDAKTSMAEAAWQFCLDRSTIDRDMRRSGVDPSA